MHGKGIRIKFPVFWYWNVGIINRNKLIIGYYYHLSGGGTDTEFRESVWGCSDYATTRRLKARSRTGGGPSVFFRIPWCLPENRRTIQRQRIIHVHFICPRATVEYNFSNRPQTPSGLLTWNAYAEVIDRSDSIKSCRTLQVKGAFCWCRTDVSVTGQTMK
jgi:hypothetical protein